MGVRAGNSAGWGGWRNSPSIGPYTPAPTPTPTPTPDPTSTPTPTTSDGLSFGDATVANQAWTKGTAITTLTLPRATRSSDGASATVGAITYSLSPALPAGLSFDAAARTISGTPTAAKAQTTYGYTATYGTDTATLSFTITVAPWPRSEVSATQEEGATGQANQAPRTIATTHDTHNQVTGSDNDCYANHSVSHPSGEGSYFEDPDGDTLTIVSSSSHPGLVAITQHDPVTIRANHPADTWVTITTRATDPGGLYADFTLEVQDDLHHQHIHVGERELAGRHQRGQGGTVQRRRQQLDHRRGRRQFFHHQQRLGQGEVRRDPGLRDQDQLQRHGQVRRGG